MVISKNGTKATTGSVAVPEQKLKTVMIGIVGETELIVHKFSTKAIKQIQDIQNKKVKTKSKRNPNQEAKDCLYKWVDGNLDGDLYPKEWDKKSTAIKSVALKMAIVRASKHIGMEMTFTRQAFHVLGEYLRIEDAEGNPADWYMRTDYVKVGKSQTDIRYRPAYLPGWRVTIPIQYDEDVISLDQILNLIKRAGFGVGIHEHRPERNGPYGRFSLDPDFKIEVVKQ